MEITEIKNKLTLATVLHYYHLKPDKQLRLNCPFHNDKTPSLQVYYKTHTAYCFSSNCKTHGKSLDVIDFIMHKESLTKREAILKAQSLISGNTETHKQPTAELTRITVLTKMFTYFKNAIHNSKPAREYIESRCLDFTKTEVGYNSGQFHHGTRKDEALIKSCIKYGLLLDLGTKGRTGNPAYKPFGKWGIVFALKNKQNQIVSLYFRSALSEKKQRHFYLRERQGLYPNYPKPTTRRLILTESIIDTATLLEQDKIKTHYEVLSLFGTNGLREEHTKAIAELKELQEIIFFLNGDQAGTKAVEKYAPMLKADYPSITISNVQVPENEDVNSLLQGHSGDILNHLVNTRKEYDFLFSNEKSIEKKKEQYPTPKLFIPTEEEQNQAVKRLVQESQGKQPKQTGLDTNNPYNLKYQGNEAKYQIKGFNINQMDSLKITLQIEMK
ncbi:MAG: toprim domain-containing protein [Flavobacteriaceae bacterium]|nr:MAG: toprim domain-containing protein [Flavobacteriaceae bacterium]QMU65830.1 MAG: toprim domain-containing protein [Flavobacteriaceae bacterium]